MRGGQGRGHGRRGALSAEAAWLEEELQPCQPAAGPGPPCLASDSRPPGLCRDLSCLLNWQTDLTCG